MRHKIEIPAMIDRDLLTVLEEHGMASKLEYGEITCVCCDEPVTWENLGGFIVLRGRLALFCSAIDCIEKAKEKNSYA